jgi:hypothetical protein
MSVVLRIPLERTEMLNDLTKIIDNSIFHESYFNSLKSGVLVLEQIMAGKIEISSDIFFGQEILADMAIKYIVTEIEGLYSHFYTETTGSTDRFIKILMEQCDDEFYSSFCPKWILSLKENSKKKIDNEKLYELCEKKENAPIYLNDLKFLSINQGNLNKLKKYHSVAAIIYEHIRCPAVHSRNQGSISIMNRIIDKKELLNIYKNVTEKLTELTYSEKKAIYQRLLNEATHSTD